MKLLSPKTHAAVFALAFAFSSSLTFAQTVWTDATGDWFTAGNWSAGVPNAATDAQINNAGTAQVGTAGAAANSLTLGLNAADSGTLSVTSPGTLAVTGGMVVGDAGTGTLNITNGGMVSNGGGATIGNTGGTGTATVDGAGSTWTNSGALNVGNDGTGTLNITNGGMVSNGSFAVIGNGGVGVATGTVTVDGAGSTWTNSGSLTVGDDGMGTLSITNGGVVSNSTAIIGDGGVLVTTGVVTVDGAGSKWTISDTLTVGDSGTGTLNITNGATVSNGVTGATIGDSGTGMVTVDGAGSTWTNNGDLTVGDSAMGTLNITHGATVSSGGATLGDGSGSTGTVTVDGSGSTWSLGGFTIGDGGPGILNITNGATVSSSGGTVGNGSTGTVTVDGTGSSWTIAGSIFVGEGGGTSTVNVTGGGTLSSNGADLGEGSNAVVTVDGAGSTWTNTGSIQVSDSVSATVNITNGGVVTTDSITISNGGTVIDDASLVSPDVEINGGLLRGTGTVTGNVFNNSGTVAPGDAPGTLTITGNYTQSSAGTLQIQIGGTAVGQHDLLAIGGTASLDGTLQLVRLNNFTGAPGDKIIFLTAAGGVSGTFATVNTGTIVGAMVVYEADDVALEFQQVAFSLTGMTINQRSVADELNKVLADPREAALIAFLSGEPLSHIPHDLDLIAPEELASIYEIGFSQAGEQNMNLMHRMDDIRAGSTGYSGPVAEISTGKDEPPISDKNVVTKNPVPAFVPCPENRWGVFVIGSGDFVNVGNDDDNARGYDITTGSVLVGADYRFGDHVAIGIDGEYDNSVADLVGGGRVDADGGKGGAFATVYGKGWFGSQIHVDLAANGGWNSYDTRRIGLQDEDVRGSTDGAEFNGLLSWGSEWTVGHLKFGTWSSLQYTYVQFNSFTERGSLAPLELPDQDQDSLRGTTGVRASYDLTFGRCGFVRPEVRVAWQHEYGDRSYPLEARLASGAGDLFPVWGPVIGRDAALVDAGVTVQWNPRFSAFVFYDGVAGRSNYDNNAVSGGLQLSF